MNISSLIPIRTSTHVPRYGMIFAKYSVVPFGWIFSWKKTPGERCSWLTITRSAPLTINVPRSVIRGMSPR